MGLNGAPMNPADLADNIHAPTSSSPAGTIRGCCPTRSRPSGRGFGGPAELVVFPGAGHVGLHSADAALWRSSVSTFLNRQAPHTTTDLGVRTQPLTP